MSDEGVISQLAYLAIVIIVRVRLTILASSSISRRGSWRTSSDTGSDRIPPVHVRTHA